MKQLFIIFGAPGSGKGYLINCIEKYMDDYEVKNRLYISTGDLLRAEIKQQTPLGKEIEQIVNSGKLVSDQIVSELVTKALKKDNQVKILDGYPRTAAQLADIEKVAANHDHDIIVIMRDTPDELIKYRVSKRRVCKNCKATHSVDDGCCPKCGGASEIRKDDSVIETRLAEYHKNTEPIWNELAKLSTSTLVFDGARDADEVAKHIVDLYCIPKIEVGA